MSESMDQQRVQFEQQIASLNQQLDEARARVTDYIPPTQYAEILADRDNWQRQYLDLQARIDQAQQQS